MSGNTGVIIAGAAETDQIGRLPGHSTLQLHLEGALNAVADAGLSLRDIDGIATVSSPGPVQVAHALGITPDWIDGTGVGGTSFLLHLLECCLVTDGGGALVVASAERAAEFGKPAVHVLGTGESSETPMISQMVDFTESQAFRRAGQAAFAEAGIGVSDVDHLMIYDAFAHVPIYGLEALGFVGKGEAGGLHRRREHRAWRVPPAQHQWRRSLLYPHRDVRHVRHPGRCPPAARRSRRTGRRPADQRHPGQRRHVRHVRRAGPGPTATLGMRYRQPAALVPAPGFQ